MGKFSSELEVTLKCEGCRDGRSEWELDVPLVYQCDTTQKFYTIPPGFTTDFASVPRVPFIFEIFGDTIHAPATLHDWLYRFAIEPRLICDRILLEAALAIGVPSWKAKAIYYAVRAFGKSHYNPK